MTSETPATPSKTSRSQDAPIRRAQILGEPAYTVEEIAKGLTVKPKTVREWIRRGELMAVRFGKRLFISQTAIKEFKEANERRQRQVMEAKRQERERQAELDRLRETEPKMEWAIANCIGCGQEPVFTTRNRRLDGDVFCASCVERGDEKVLSKDDWERKVRLRVDELNRIEAEALDANERETLGRWREPYLIYRCPLCDKPSELGRQDLLDPQFLPGCDHGDPYRLKPRFEKEAVADMLADQEFGIERVPGQELIFLAKRPVAIADLARIEAIERNRAAGVDPALDPECSLCSCSHCARRLAVATYGERLLGETCCRLCVQSKTSARSAYRLSVILEALVERKGSGFELRRCASGCEESCELWDVSSQEGGPMLLLSRCQQLSADERQRHAMGYADFLDLPEASTGRLLSWITNEPAAEAAASDLSFLEELGVQEEA